MIKKTTLLLSLILSFSLVFATQPNEGFRKRIKKKQICKTWFVSQAYRYEAGKEKNNKTQEARGSLFIFNKDNSFKLIDNSKRRVSEEQGGWKISGKDSILIEMKEIKLVFKVVFLSKDSLHIVSTEKQNSRSMHITFSSDTILPLRSKDRESHYETAESTIEVESESYDYKEEVAKETLEIPRIKNKLEQQLCKTWIIYKGYFNEENVTDEIKGSTFTFKENHSFIFVEAKDSDTRPPAGSWKKISENSISITNEGETTIFKIASISDHLLTLKAEDESEYVTFYLKAAK